MPANDHEEDGCRRIRLTPMNTRNATILFFAGVIVAAAGILSPPVALLAGLVFGLTVAHPLPGQSTGLAKFLLQAAVVLLGFGMNLGEVLRAGREGFVYTACGIAFAIGLGLLLGKLLRVSPVGSLLITCGTAICGGSAIAAIAPIANAGEEDLAVSLATIFSLNAVALFLFPAVGWAMHLSQTQFGLWSALAIHDTSSVVGATARYGSRALEVGTTVKLMRALWIVPVSLAVATITQRQLTARRAAGEQTDAGVAKITIPWFIGLFLVAALVRSYLPQGAALWIRLNGLGKSGLTVVLFLIGTGLNRQALRRVGVRPLAQGVALWIIVATVSLTAIRLGWISL